MYSQAPFAKTISIYDLTSLSRHDISSLQKYLKDIARIKEKEDRLGMKVFGLRPDPAKEGDKKQEVDDTPDDDEEDEKELELYTELKDRDPVNEEEIDVYLKHHTLHGAPLDDDQKEFARQDLMDRLNNNKTRFNKEKAAARRQKEKDDLENAMIAG